MVKEVGARRSTLARTLQQVGSRAKAHNQKTVKQHLVEYADSHVEGAQMLWWLVEQKWVDYLLDIQKGGGQEKPLAQSQNKFDALPIYVYESILKESPHVPGYFKSASNMKKLRVKDRCIHKKLVQMASAVPRDFPIAAGTTPSEAVDLLCSRIAAVGDRLNGMTISENGIVDWASSSPWKWHVSANGGHIVVEHKFIQAQAPWETLQAQQMAKLWPEASWLVDCSGTLEELHKADQLWLAAAALPGMVLRRKGTHQWLMSLGSVQQVAMLATPLQQHHVRGHDFFLLQHLSVDTELPYQWLFIVDDSHWEVLSCRAVSPARFHVMLQHGSADDHTTSSSMLQSPHICLCSSGDTVESLRAACSRRGFSNLPVRLVLKLLAHWGCHVNDSADECSIIETAVQHIFQHAASDELVLMALAGRESGMLADDAFWESEELLDCFDEAEQRELEAYMKEEKIVAKTFRAGVALKRKPFAERSSTPESPLGSKSALRERSSASASSHMTRPAPAPTILTVQMLQPFAPSGWRLMQRVVDNRWKISHRVLGALSRTWTLHGHQGAAAMCLKFAYERSCVPCPHQWINDALKDW